MIRGAGHFQFGDGAMLRIPLVMHALRKLGIVHLDGRRQVAVTTRCISTFFDVHLKGAPSSELRNHPEFSEIEYVH
jgi:hypothetical protein